jgi:hypothetical protein
MPAWPFVFYCLIGKIGTLGERPLLAQSGRPQECPLLGEQRKTYARIEVFRV